MKPRHHKAIAVCLVLTAHAAAAGNKATEALVTRGIDHLEHVALEGDVPIDDFPNIQRRSDEIWSFLTQHLGLPSQVPAPVIYFDAFDKGAQSPEWTAWQKVWTRTHLVIWRDWTALRSHKSTTEISQEWIDSNIDEIFPFPTNFLAFHYDGTNRIQINPDRTFRASMQMDPYGIRRDLDGYGYYSAAHEMLHYALEIKGIVPTKLHHCLMIYAPEDQYTPGLMEQLTDYLVDTGTIAPISRYRGLSTERALAPCEGLSADELEQVARFREQLGLEPVRLEAASAEHKTSGSEGWGR